MPAALAAFSGGAPEYHCLRRAFRAWPARGGISARLPLRRVVCINEAIELAKRYSDEKVAKMINGVLDKIYHEIEDNCE